MENTEVEQSTQNVESNNVESDIEEVDVQIKKAKKPRSEKQIEHFKNMAEKRKQNIEQKKLQKKRK